MYLAESTWLVLESTRLLLWCLGVIHTDKWQIKWSNHPVSIKMGFFINEKCTVGEWEIWHEKKQKKKQGDCN